MTGKHSARSRGNLRLLEMRARESGVGGFLHSVPQHAGVSLPEMLARAAARRRLRQLRHKHGRLRRSGTRAHHGGGRSPLVGQVLGRRRSLRANSFHTVRRPDRDAPLARYPARLKGPFQAVTSVSCATPTPRLIFFPRLMRRSRRSSRSFRESCSSGA